MMKRAVFILSLFFLSACVRNPEVPSGGDSEQRGASGLYVLNEGLFGRDNASMTFYNRITGKVFQNFFQTVNPDLRLGDTANSMTVFHNQGYIVMNGSNTIEIIDMASAESLGRIIFAGNPSLRQAVVLNDTLGFVTALFSDELIQFNPAARRVAGTISVGPAPEGIAAIGEVLFVANSGLGDIRANEPGAGTLSVIGIHSGAEGTRLPVLRNCTSIQKGPDGWIYVSGTGSYAENVITGIAVIDPAIPAVMDTIRIANHPTDFVLGENGLGYVLTDSAVVKFNWRNRKVVDSFFIAKEKLGAGSWFSSIALDEQRQELYVGNARNFTTNGEVVCFDLNGNEKFRFPTKINPGTIVLKQ